MLPPQPHVLRTLDTRRSSDDHSLLSGNDFRAGRGTLSWPAFVIPAIGIASLVLFVRSLLLIFSPARGKLGKSVRPYMDGTIHTDVRSMFALIDKDIMQNGKRLGTVWVARSGCWAKAPCA